MSGYRWSSLLPFSLVVLLTGCQSSESSRFAWNPFRKSAEKATADKNGSALELPKFASRKSESPEESARQAPMAEEQVDRLLADGQLALQEERFEEARIAYNEVLSSSPENATAHHGLAMAADLSEQWADAEYHYRQALRIRPRDANLLCDIGYSYLLQNRYAEAARYLNHAIEVNPQHESAHMNLALLDLRQGNRQAAESRVISKFGSGTQAMQIMAQLEGQTTAVTAAFKADAATSIPSNATFEQVQELARRERLEAERRRASQGMSQEPAGQPLNQMNPQPMMPQVQHQPMTGSDIQVVSNRNGLPTGSGYDANTGLPISIPGARHAALTGRSGGSLQNGQTWSNGAVSGPMLDPGQSAGGSPSNDIRAYGGEWPSPNNPQGLPQPGNYVPGKNGMPSISGVSVSNDMMSSGAASSNSPVTTPSPQNSLVNVMSVHNNVYGNTLPSGTMNSNSVAAPQSPDLNPLPAIVVPIHSSGAFQAPQNGSVSYGQPMGFNAPAATTSQAPVPSAKAYSAPVNSSGSPAVYLEGLNTGPGAIFPVSGSTPAVGTPANAAGGSANLNMNNVSSPGTNSMVNGAMYQQPESALPSQDWANQQQQQLRAQQLQSQRWQEQQAMGRQQGTAPPQNSPSWGTGSYGAPGSSPGSRPAVVNPLEAYEKQRQQLDSEYNRTLQQLDRQSPSAMPQF
jgi:Tfp pilus assembly protein PilF